MITIPEAVRALREGRLVAFPTETVYGLGADACNAEAVQSIFAAKGRPSRRALICHVTDTAMAKAQVVAEWPAIADRLATRYWPGPLTLILRRAGGIPDEVTGGGATVGVRAPDHAMALELIKAFDGPIAAPSANRFDEPPPVNARQVEKAFREHANISVLDGGPTPGGLESTVLDLSAGPPLVRRVGAIAVEDLETLLGLKIGQARPIAERPELERERSAFSFRSDQWPDLQRRLTASDVVLSMSLSWDGPGGRSLPPTGPEYAQQFFDALHEARERTTRAEPPGRIFIEWPDENQFPGGLWPSIRERIRRYARPVE